MAISPESNQQTFDIESYPPEIVKKIHKLGIDVETFSQIVMTETGGIYPVRSGSAGLHDLHDLFKAPIEEPYIRRSSQAGIRQYRRWFNSLSRYRKNIILRMTREAVS